MPELIPLEVYSILAKKKNPYKKRVPVPLPLGKYTVFVAMSLVFIFVTLFPRRILVYIVIFYPELVLIVSFVVFGKPLGCQILSTLRLATSTEGTSHSGYFVLYSRPK